VANARCRLAGFAYTARFEWVLDAIERDEFHLRPNYDERKSVGAGLSMLGQALSALIDQHTSKSAPQAVPMRPRSVREL
jgi:hypothetical protein